MAHATGRTRGETETAISRGVVLYANPSKPFFVQAAMRHAPPGRFRSLNIPPDGHLNWLGIKLATRRGGGSLFTNY